MIITKKIDMLFLLMRKEIGLYLGIYILIIFKVNAQCIEVQDSVKNKRVKSIRAYSITKDSKSLFEENLYNEKGQIIQEAVYKRNFSERKIFSRENETGLLKYITTTQNGKTCYTAVVYDSIPGIIPFDSIKTLIRKLPDSINSILHYNYIPGGKVIFQESVYSRSNFGYINLYNYNNSKRIRAENYIYKNEKELLPIVRIEEWEYNQQGKVIKSSLRLFPADLNTNSHYTITKDKKGRESQIASQDEKGLLSLTKIKYKEAKHQKVVQIYKPKKLIEERIYSMDEYGNYLTVSINNIDKYGKKVEVIYEYY